MSCNEMSWQELMDTIDSFNASFMIVGTIAEKAAEQKTYLLDLMKPEMRDLFEKEIDFEDRQQLEELWQKVKKLSEDQRLYAIACALYMYGASKSDLDKKIVQYITANRKPKYFIGMVASLITPKIGIYLMTSGLISVDVLKVRIAFEGVRSGEINPKEERDEVGT